MQGYSNLQISICRFYSFVSHLQQCSFTVGLLQASSLRWSAQSIAPPFLCVDWLLMTSCINCIKFPLSYCREHLPNVVAHHLARTLQLYHVSCYLWHFPTSLIPVSTFLVVGWLNLRIHLLLCPIAWKLGASLCSPMFISILTEDIGPRHLCKPSLGSRDWMQSSSTSFGNFKLNYGDFVSAKKNFCVLEQIISPVMSDHNSVYRILLFISLLMKEKMLNTFYFPLKIDFNFTCAKCCKSFRFIYGEKRV